MLSALFGPDTVKELGSSLLVGASFKLVGAWGKNPGTK